MSKIDELPHGNLLNCIAILRTGCEPDSSVEYWYACEDGYVLVRGHYPLNTPKEDSFYLSSAEALRQYLLQTNGSYKDHASDGDSFIAWVEQLDLRRPSVMITIPEEGQVEVSVSGDIAVEIADFESYANDEENVADPQPLLTAWFSSHPDSSIVY